MAFTDRFGGPENASLTRAGVAPAPLDLALVDTGDPDAATRADRTAGLAALLHDFAPGAGLADMEQVHGSEVREVTGPGRQTCDAIFTRCTDLVLLVRVADCVPVVLADPRAGVVAVVHAGRTGLVGGVVPTAVEALRDHGARQLTGWLGPRICGACYEVPVDLQDHVGGAVPPSRSVTRWDTPGLDVGAGVRHQLESLDVTVHDVGECTFESSSLFSYRRDGAAAGRLAGLVRMRP